MKRNRTLVLVGALVTGIIVAGCSVPAEAPPSEEAIHIEELDSGLKTLTPRLGKPSVSASKRRRSRTPARKP